MEKRVALELRGRSPAQVKELNLDNCRSTTIVGLTDEYVNLEILSLNNVGLTTLKDFPTLPKLRILELSDNRISKISSFLRGCKKITHLNLSGNKIKDLETLKPIKDFEDLKNLDLFNNEVTSIEDYRSKVFNLHPSLKYLDGFDKEYREEDDSTGDEDESEGDEGEEEEDSEHSLAEVLNDNLEEESSASSLYEGSLVDGSDLDDEEEDDDDDENNETNKTQDGAENADGSPEESTRGKKRKHEDEEEN